MDARFALLLGCFVLSGFAALLYQTVWTRELSFVFGTSDLAVAAVLAAYMGGLALGSAIAARLAARVQRPVRAYGWIELGIAASALLVPSAIAGVEAIYVALLGGAPELPEGPVGTGALLQLLGAAVVLFVPTALMGATLPLLAGWAVRIDRQLGARVGALYAMNTAGAIVGTVGSAFWWIPALGLQRTAWIGAAANAAVFALALGLARRAPAAGPAEPAVDVAPDRSARWVLPAIAISGAVSFAYEVLWTRLLGQVLGGSLHAFATMLASFLLGITLGSAIAARFATTRARARAGFAIAQLGTALLGYAVFACADRLPELAAWLGAGRATSLASAAFAAAALLPITLCIGATFPFAVRILAARRDDAAPDTARVYAWNTCGAIAGSLGAGFVALPALGFAGTVALGVALCLALALLAALASTPRRIVLAAIAVVFAVALAVRPPATPWALLRSSPLQDRAAGEILFSAVGRSSTVLLIDQPLAFRLSTNGLPEAAIERTGTLQMPATLPYWLGLLPTLVRPETRDLLVIGLGGGSGIESIPSTVTAIDVIELEPEVVAANRVASPQRARDPLADPRVRMHIGDARGALSLVERRYGAIVSQPSHPWTAGASHLYTREFFAQVRDRLAPDGVFVQWIALPFLDEALLRSLAGTLDDAFGHVQIYAPSGPGLLFAASAQPLSGLAGAQRALAAAPADFARFGVSRIEDVAAAWLLDEAGVRALGEGAPRITDDTNALAARAGELGDRALRPDTARPLFAADDPLRAHLAELDPSPLLRSLVQHGYLPRAKQLAEGLPAGAERERALGWIELADSRLRSAVRRFEQARVLAPDDRSALDGLVASRKTELEHGPAQGIPEAELSSNAAAVVAGWRAAVAKDWAAVTALDAQLAAVVRGDAFYREAARLRAAARLEDSPADPRGALAILTDSLTYSWHPEDALLHARAAVDAGELAIARGALERIVAQAPRDDRGRDLARRGFALTERMPLAEVVELRLRLGQLASMRVRGAESAVIAR